MRALPKEPDTSGQLRLALTEQELVLAHVPPSSLPKLFRRSPASLP